jgi:hypothetical protein
VRGFFWLVFLVAGWGIGGDESLRCLLAAAGFQGKPSTATGREDKPDRPAPSGQL